MNQPHDPETFDSPKFGLLAGPLGGLILRPWYDRIALKGVARWYLPLSRIWAEGVDEPDSAKLAEIMEIPAKHRDSLKTAHGKLHRRWEAHREAEWTWREAFFEGREASLGELYDLEEKRGLAATKYMGARFYFKGLHRKLKFPARLGAPDRGFPAPSKAQMQVSREISSYYGGLSWLRWMAPRTHASALEELAYARVVEPLHHEGPRPTLIYLHGIAMETEYLPEQTVDATSLLARMGVRVIKPVAPGHSMRRVRHRYGGEPVIAEGPKGMIELLQQWGTELGQLVAYARERWGGPVAVGGVSLGALTAQKMASVSANWPKEMQPDALFLVTTTGDLVSLAFEGSLVKASGLPPHLEAAGWTQEALAPLRPLFDPIDEPPMPADKRVMLLGSADNLTPFKGGRELAQRWEIPNENLFIRYQGHFTGSLGLIHQQQPMQRIADILTLAR